MQYYATYRMLIVISDDHELHLKVTTFSNVK